MIFLEGGNDLYLDVIQTPRTGTCRSDDLLFVAQEYKFTFYRRKGAEKHVFPVVSASCSYGVLK